MSQEVASQEATWATPRSLTPHADTMPSAAPVQSDMHYVVPPHAVVDESAPLKDEKVVSMVRVVERNDAETASPSELGGTADSDLDSEGGCAIRHSASVKTMPRVATSQSFGKRPSRHLSVTLDGDVTFENTPEETVPFEEIDVELDRRERIHKALNAIINSSAYSILGALFLGIALFGGGLFIICDVPDDPGTALQDTIMILATFFFIIELALLSAGETGYWLSAFFFMDLLGTVSMIFEISFLLGRAGKMVSASEAPNTVLMKAARAAKVGARTARLSKVAKCFSFVMRRHKNEDSAGNMPEYDATVLKTRLTQALSTRVSLLTVALVVGVPLFNIGRYPEDDFSTRGWSRALELTYSLSYQSLETYPQINTTDMFYLSVQELNDFYDLLSYSPYRLEGYPNQLVINNRDVTIPGELSVNKEKPSRNQNILKQEVDKCRMTRPGCQGNEKPAMYFDLRKPNQYEAGMDIALILFVIVCMVAEAFEMNHTIDLIMVKPVERMLGTVQMMAQILNTVQSKGGFDDETTEELIIKSPHSEATSLELVFKRLSDLTVQFLKSSMVAEEELEEMDDESKGIVVDILQLRKQPDQQLFAIQKQRSDDEVVVSDKNVDEDAIASWELPVMEMSAEDLRNVMMFVYFDSKLGRRTGRIWTDPAKFLAFHDVVKAGYLDNPYHSYTHAADVVTCVFRVMLDLRCDEWLSEVDMYALMVSALCHDIGHPGKTTPFLVETSHELAVRYNDSSPLENMHCARLFEICGHDATNIFSRLEKDAYKQARKVCICAILHTDNAQHFDMVKAVKRVYDMYQDLCDAQVCDQEMLIPQYVEEVLCKDTTMWHKLILHFSDVATPMKPFPISRAWATRVQDEFFSQGDAEKDLGIPVGMLNDRDKVSRSGAEHGFINFLVAPLVFPTIGVFPPLLHLAEQMGHNMEEWRNLWVKDTNPSPEDIKKRDGEVQKVQDQVEKLKHRKVVPTIRTSVKLEPAGALNSPGAHGPVRSRSMVEADFKQASSGEAKWKPAFSTDSRGVGMGSKAGRNGSQLVIPVKQH